MTTNVWEFWIDVGGTFTDCFGRRPDGALVRHKLLSSGTTKGECGPESAGTAIHDAARKHDPAGFWNGATLRLLDADGGVLATATVRNFDHRNGTLQLAESMPSIAPGRGYELITEDEAPVLAVRYMLGLARHDPIPPVTVKLGTTRGTNALITRRGARTAFITTRGFGDILRIGYQNRPRLFELAVKKKQDLFCRSVEIDERVNSNGDVLRAPDADTIRKQLEPLRADGIESLAICLLHAYQFSAHEELVERIARELGFAEISVSHRVAPLVKIVSRGDTTVMDAYLNPILRSYVEKLRWSLGSACDLRIMTSAGGLVAADRFVGKDSILSGPAGGVVGFSRVAQGAGFDKAIGFDMGGTSTDVSRFEGRYELEFETEKSGVRVVAPMMAIETVAAGGGSICHFDGVKLAVGPDSAGADPGPACYGRGGPLAVTDLNLYLGKILPQHFPFPLDRSAVEKRLAAICEEIAVEGTRYTPLELADGFLRVANANMVKAIRSISVAKGCDPRDYVLAAFGGAAAQHACAVARELGMTQILLHPDAGILSAYGIGMADIVRHRAAGIYKPYSPQTLAELQPALAQLVDEARDEVRREGVADGQIEVIRQLELRYKGVDATLVIPEPADGDYMTAYLAEHQKLYGYIHPRRELEIVAARVEAIGHMHESQPAPRPLESREPVPEDETTLYFQAQPHRAGIFDRRSLRPGDELAGPAVIYEEVSTTVVDPGWVARVLARGELLLIDTSAANSTGRRQRAAGSTSSIQTSAERTIDPSSPDPATLEIFNHQFAGIAEQMGITLRNTSSSVNVKERLDFSCAIFTARGDLVVNAPHIPVHLGAMGETVRRIILDNPDMQPGDVYVTNDPYRGGSHLPDVTVVTPVQEPSTGRLLFFTASRAHHAEIGGITPGSMPPFSKNLAEEGVLIRNFKLVDSGTSRGDEYRTLLTGGPFPSRSVEDNLADTSAQVAANNQGVRDLLRLVERYSLPVVEAYMQHIQSAAEQKMRRALLRLEDRCYEFTDHLDDGSPIHVVIDKRGDTARFDFTGTGPVLASNLNANSAIVTAAVMYSLRLLIDEDIPLNQGMLAPVEIVVPECLLSPPDAGEPAQCAAVVGGNVETSQRVVDTVLGALGLAAASQGTMNNILFGDKTFGYYETICGGSGATADSDGADAIHTHMTNTRLTDPEVLERRYPVRVVEFSIRRGSGGKGKHRGGDGVVRRLQFLRRVDVSLLHQRRGPYAPYGLNGGSPGALGRNTLDRAKNPEAVNALCTNSPTTNNLSTNNLGDSRSACDTSLEHLPGRVQFVAEPGDILTIETPGAGGYGSDSTRVKNC